MNLNFNKDLAHGYKNKAQIARRLSENWVLNNSYCPRCGEIPLKEFENNLPVADFYCKSCSEEFELKCKRGKISKMVSDGAYSTMIKRINAENNPNFFFLNYTENMTVADFFIIPKQFFSNDVIIKRAPLKNTAKRAGWVSCNIDISGIADTGKVFFVKNAEVVNRDEVKHAFNKMLFLRSESQVSKSWILDIMLCIDQINTGSFMLNDVYKFEERL